MTKNDTASVALAIGSAVSLLFTVHCDASAAEGGNVVGKNLLVSYRDLATEPTRVLSQLPRRFGWLVRNYSYDRLIDRADFSSLSDEVKVNRKLFFFGPEYEYKSNSYQTTVTVMFNFSACAESIALYRTKAKQSNEFPATESTNWLRSRRY